MDRVTDSGRADEREEMVRAQLVARDIVDPAVLAAMTAVPRHRFVPLEQQRLAYDDRPLAIGHGATISQPYIVALIVQLGRVRPGARVLDVGTGSGYQAAIAAHIGAHVCGIERIPELAVRARGQLAELGHAIDIVHGDGWGGRPERAPFDAILVAAAAEQLPGALVDQLAIGGRLVIPIGGPGAQRLDVVTRTRRGNEHESITAVSFIPLVRDDPQGHD